ncbi:MAG: hypothetical protein GY802_27775 [Gammaproteobacteria bacterium]|nr:hypothetical protein [Gammaproteobacteria bacterium]
MMQLVREEIEAGLRKRSVYGKFLRFNQFAGMKLNTSNRRSTGSELNGHCRLKWYDHLMRHHLQAPAEAEQFTRQLHRDALNHHEGLAEVLATAAVKLDLSRRPAAPVREVASPESKAAMEINKGMFPFSLGFLGAK